MIHLFYSEELRLIEFNQLIFLQSPLNIFALYFFSIIIHEIGHATALVKYTSKTGAIGFGIYYIFPVLYADVNASWKLNKYQRMLVSFSGIYFQGICLVAFLCIGIYNENATIISACNLITLSILFTLNPLFKFDGYWILSDIVDTTNLHTYIAKGLSLKSKTCIKQSLISYFYLIVSLSYLLLIIEFVTRQFELLNTLVEDFKYGMTITSSLGFLLALVLFTFMALGLCRILNKIFHFMTDIIR
jgi:putative peptide zinc metalloprotease protein